MRKLRLLLGIVVVTMCAAGVYQFAIRSTSSITAPARDTLSAARPEIGKPSRNDLRAAASAQAEPLQLSTRLLDFGSVLLKSPSERTLVMVSHEAVRVRLSGLPSDSPFRAPDQVLSLNAGSPTEMTFTFDPAQPGLYRHQLRLELEGSAPQTITIALRGRAAVPPDAAGVVVPPPPDLIIRQHREQEIAKAMAEARAAAADRAASQPGDPTDDEGDGTSDDGVEGDESGSGDAMSAKRATSPGGPGGRAPALMAFGEFVSPADDLNNVPVPLPDGETTPDLPPPDEDPDAGNPPQSDQEEAQSENPRTRRLPKFTVAPNSSILVSSGEQQIPGQSFTLRLSANRSAFVIGGRLRLPDMGFAFGESMSIDQWGDIQGSVASNGIVQMQMVVRLNDPNGNVVDLPVTLTTEMAVGYSSQGRVMFVNGSRLDSQGDLKLVGISNIPIGVGSSLDKAPIYIQLLGRLEL